MVTVHSKILNHSKEDVDFYQPRKIKSEMFSGVSKGLDVFVLERYMHSFLYILGHRRTR